MKITDLTPYVVQRPGEGNWVFVRLDTDEGLVGWGEAGERLGYALDESWLRAHAAPDAP